MTTSDIAPALADASSLRALCGGAVHLPGDPGYDDARVPWNVAVDQRPAAVAYPVDASEVVAIVRAARDAGLRVAPQGTGHNARPLEGRLDDVVLLRTAGMQGVRIDPQARTARVEAGVLWLDVVEAAAEHDLAALHGSSPDVGVVGYSLGAGMGWYARALGLQTNSITAVELVTADGELVRADEQHETDLFWAVRGGGGNFGVVTALEFRLYPVTEAYGGMLVWDWSLAREVLSRWASWAVDAPDAVTTSFRLLQLPPLEELPEAFRGRALAVIDGAVLADAVEAERILAPLRELAPEMDTFATVPAASLVRLHMDPEGPTPGVSDSSVLSAFPEEAVDAFLEAAGPGSGTSLLLSELRQLGGALGRPHPGAGALPRLEGQFVMFAAAIPTDAAAAEAGMRDARRLRTALAPWDNGAQYLNFAENRIDASAGYTTQAWARLRELRRRTDPDGRIVANHAVEPAEVAVPEQR